MGPYCSSSLIFCFRKVTIALPRQLFRDNSCLKNVSLCDCNSKICKSRDLSYWSLLRNCFDYMFQVVKTLANSIRNLTNKISFLLGYLMTLFYTLNKTFMYIHLHKNYSEDSNATPKNAQYTLRKF